MNTPRPATEDVMKALFALVQNVNNVTPPQPKPFKVVSRRFRHFNDVPPEEMPAFFQFQSPERRVTGGDRPLPVDRIGVNWLCYLPGQKDLTTPVSPQMNQYYDLLSNLILRPAPTFTGGTKNTLGGLVQNCYIDGAALTDEGLLDTPSIIIIPIIIQIGI